MSSKKIRLLIVDDHKIFIEGLVSLLESFEEISVVATAFNGSEALNLLANVQVDVVITDINMPVMDGLKLTKEIKSKYPKVKVLALTMLNEGNMISVMLKSGITGYILKDTSKEELLTAITTVANGENFFSEAVSEALMKSMMTGKKDPTRSDVIPELSERELEVLKLIATEYTQQQIADKLFISPHTVSFHRRKLFYKFDVKNTAGLVKAAIEKGLIN